MTIAPYISALLAENSDDGDTTTGNRWNFPDPVGSAVSLTYAFMTSVPSYSTGIRAFAPLDSAHQAAVRTALATYASICGLRFTETSVVATSDLTFGANWQADSDGYAYYPSFSYSLDQDGAYIPGSETATSLAGDVWLSNAESESAARQTPSAGSHAYQTILHEIGHALGLKHPFDGAPTLSGQGLTDTTQYSLMSYTSPTNSNILSVSGNSSSWSWTYTPLDPSTPMVYDIAALQYLYGANRTTRASATTYRWESNSAFYQTIWDGGGVNTIDVRNYSLRCEINLTAGSYSSIGLRRTLAEKVIDTPAWFQAVAQNNAYTRQSLSQSSLYDGANNLGIAYGTLIQNALGGTAGDLLQGNAAANSLDGGAGADTLLGGAGNDTYILDTTADRVYETTRIGSSLDAGGIDTVRASVSWSLGAYCENLTLTGTGALNGSGNALANVITGNAGNNRLSGDRGNDTLTGGAGLDSLIGGLGADCLTGGAGADLFCYSTAGEGGDRITDFVRGTDHLQFVRGGFGALTSALLAGGGFVANRTGTAIGRRAQFVFNTATGALIYDSNGADAGAAVTIATLNSRTLSASDLVMVSS